MSNEVGRMDHAFDFAFGRPRDLPLTPRTESYDTESPDCTVDPHTSMAQFHTVVTVQLLPSTPVRSMMRSAIE